jgi:hypothetical protein
MDMIPEMESTLSTPFSQLAQTPYSSSSLGYSPFHSKRKIHEVFSPGVSALVEEIDLEQTPETPESESKRQYFR